VTASPPKTGVALLVSPNGTDAELAIAFLREHAIESRAFRNVGEVLPVLDATAGCLVLLEEALVADTLPLLRARLRDMPAWCDLPLIVVSRDASALARLASEAFPESGNVTLLERPLNPHTLVSAVQVALRAAARQRQVGDLLEQRAQAVKLRDEFLAMLAHELRNPLAPMSNALHIMRIPEAGEPARRSSMEILERQVRHIVRMVDDLLDVARLERGKIVLQPQRIDMNRVVGASVETCLPFVQQRGHRVSLDLHPEALPVDADMVRIEQIVANLVNNAAKFTPAPGEVRVRTSMEGDNAVIIV
jgi:signal transduction histidine kinase